MKISKHKVLDFIDVLPGPGTEYEPPEGLKILWVQIAYKSPERLPKTLHLSQVRLQPDIAPQGIGFGGADEDPAIHHVLKPGASGTIKTSGDDVGDCVYDAGQQTVTFTRFPTTLSLVFLVTAEPPNVVITGLFGETVTAK